jgi:hypothetical protein
VAGNSTYSTSSVSDTLAVTLAAGDVSLSAGNLILQQDNGGPQPPAAAAQGVGSYITRTLSLAGYGEQSPTTIDLYGVFVSTGAGPTGLLSGAAAATSTQVSLAPSLQASAYRTFYRINSCEFGVAGVCGSAASLLQGLPLDPVDQGVTLTLGDLTLPGPSQFPDDAFASDDQDNPGVFVTASNAQAPGAPPAIGDASFPDDPFAALGQRASHPSIVLGWQIRNGLLRFDDPDIEDRMITGAASEEIWRGSEDRP